VRGSYLESGDMLREKREKTRLQRKGLGGGGGGGVWGWGGRRRPAKESSEEAK